MSGGNPASNKGGGRGGGSGSGGGRGRGRGGRGRGGGRRSNRNSSNQQQQSKGGTNTNNGNHSLASTGQPQYRDEEALIAFMPYLKADDQRAIAIHEEYQSTNDSSMFLKATREFLASKAAGVTNEDGEQTPTPNTSKAISSPASVNPPAPAPATNAWAQPPPPAATPATPSNNPRSSYSPTPGSTTHVAPSMPPIQTPIRPSMGFPSNNGSLTATPVSTVPDTSRPANQPLLQHSMMSDCSPIPQQQRMNNPSTMFDLSGMLPPPPPPTPQNQQRQQEIGGSRLSSALDMLFDSHMTTMVSSPPPPPPPLGQQHQSSMSSQQLQQQQHGYPMRLEHQQPLQPLNMMESLELQLDRLIDGDEIGRQSMPLSSEPRTPARPPHSPGTIGTPGNHGMTRQNNGNAIAMQDPATSFLSGFMSLPHPNSSSGYNNNNSNMGEFNQMSSGLTQIQQQQQEQQQRHEFLLQQQQLQLQRQAQQLHQQQQMIRQRQNAGMMTPPGSAVTPTTPRSPALSATGVTNRPPSSLALSQTSTPRSHLSPVMGPQVTPQPAAAAKTPRKEVLQQRRMWTRIDDQPGRVFVNDVNVSDPHVVLDVRPRKEIKARWVISWKYLQQRAEEVAKKRAERAESEGGILPPTDENPMNRIIPNLRLGLFRRGCAENGAQASIISKSVMVSGGAGRSPYLDQQNQLVVGTVPFYSPRTPGHVVFRLYWDDEPLYTLGVGPTLHVRVMEEDYESTTRFLLSNMKKKVNPTSLSSLHSLAQVLETVLKPPNQTSRGGRQQQQSNDHRAGRATWGCICEARKVLDACASEYAKTSLRLSKLAVDVDNLKAEVDEEDTKQLEDAVIEVPNIGDSEEPGGKFDDAEVDASKVLNGDDEENDDERLQELREKTRALMSGRASCERKWRDSQLAFASILKAVAKNPSMPMLLRQDMIQKMRLEYELWCPLCEEFSIIDSNGESPTVNGQISSEDGEVPQIDMWYDKLKTFPSLLTTEHVRICQQSRAQMQLKTLGFVPNTKTLQEILFSSGGKATTAMDPSAVAVFNQLSGAMGKAFQDVFTPEVEQRVSRQREMIRSQLELLVQQCDSFPPGTKVAIFGSSANGFGTPQSDLDMCLQLPQGASIGDNENDPSGSQAMSKLAEKMKEQADSSATDPLSSSFKITDVDTARLTARIPIVMFRCPIVRGDGTEDVMECDLSMHNPLAVMNTRFLRTYADINPVTRVMAFVIKRWAKARDINNPARHTLSSYGYIIMLLHYLTYHQRTGNGLTAPVAGPEGKPLRQNNQVKPLLPNLLWMDANWPKEKQGTPYREMPTRPKSIVQHPMEKVNVNTYFYRPANQADLASVMRHFPSQDLSLAILLTSFFRYYAFEFDYKRFVVSLHSTASRGLVEREVKAELDGWRHYSAALTIEDPFETFYDVAHVLRGGYYHRIRREFAVAYSKIADAVSGNKNSTWTDANGDKVDPSAMTGMDLVDWICEPVATAAAEVATV